MNARRDDLHVAAAAVADLVDELARDVDDGRSWDGPTRDEHVRRLVAVAADLQRALV